MAHFWGYVSGRSKTNASRCGTRNTGLSGSLLSWNGGINVHLWHDHQHGHDMTDVALVPHLHGSGLRQHRTTLYNGPVHLDPGDQSSLVKRAVYHVGWRVAGRLVLAPNVFDTFADADAYKSRIHPDMGPVILMEAS